MAPLLKFAVLLNLSLYAAAQQDTQFITGACTADADCASGCCGFTSGLCAARIPAAERGEGCGFGDAAPNSLDAAPNANVNGNNATAGAVQVDEQPAEAELEVEAEVEAAENATGTQFITGECAADADCASGCCGFASGLCAARLVAVERGEGCGFGDGAPNGLDGAAEEEVVEEVEAVDEAEVVEEAEAERVDADAVADANANDNAAKDGQQKAPAATPPGTQFITGPCASDADCALGCCGFNTGRCAGPVVAQERDGGCGFGDAAPNDDAAGAARAARGLGRRGVQFWM